MNRRKHRELRQATLGAEFGGCPNVDVLDCARSGLNSVDVPNVDVLD